MRVGFVEPDPLPGIAHNAVLEPIAPRVRKDPENVTGELVERQDREVTR